jgi:hypothetical protein
VNAQARALGIPPLRFVREAAVGKVAATPFTAARGGTWRARGVHVQIRDEAVLGLAELLASIRALEDFFEGEPDCRRVLASAADRAEQGILSAASGAADLELIDWAKAAFRDAFPALIRRVESRGSTPPPRVAMSLIEPLIAGLEAAVRCGPSSSPRALSGGAAEGALTHEKGNAPGGVNRRPGISLSREDLDYRSARQATAAQEVRPASNANQKNATVTPSGTSAR